MGHTYDFTIEYIPRYGMIEFGCYRWMAYHPFYEYYHTETLGL